MSAVGGSGLQANVPGRQLATQSGHRQHAAHRSEFKIAHALSIDSFSWWIVNRQDDHVALA